MTFGYERDDTHRRIRVTFQEPVTEADATVSSPAKSPMARGRIRSWTRRGCCSRHPR